MSDKKILIARKAKKALRTDPIYSIKVIPKTVTINSIVLILNAQESGNYAALFKSELYNKYSCVYCNLLCILSEIKENN